jgi:hypothetical protein
MAQKITLNGVDVTAYLAYGSVVIKRNTCDFALIDPPGAAELTYLITGQTVVVKDPNWTGTTTGAEIRDIVDLATGHFMVLVTATNSAPNNVSTYTPFNLSDAPSAATASHFTLEDGSGVLLLEDGTAWAPGDYQLENATDSFGYSGFFLRKVDDGTNQWFVGGFTCQQPGLYPGMVVQGSSANLAISNEAWTISQVTTKWQGLAVPVFLVEFTSGAVLLYTLNTWRLH